MNRFFNLNTGYFIKSRLYEYNNDFCIGYLICRGYSIFYIPGYDVIAYCCDKDTLIRNLKQLNINNIEIPDEEY